MDKIFFNYTSSHDAKEQYQFYATHPKDEEESQWNTIGSNHLRYITDFLLVNLFNPGHGTGPEEIPPSRIGDFLGFQLAYHEEQGGNREVFLNYILDTIQTYIHQKPELRTHPSIPRIQDWYDKFVNKEETEYQEENGKIICGGNKLTVKKYENGY